MGVKVRAVGAVAGCVALFAGGWFAPAAVAQDDPCANAGLRVGASAGLPDCRALELVSPPDKVGGTGVGIWYSGPNAAGFAGHAAYEGERFAVRGEWGSVLTDAPFAFANDWALAERSGAGWVSKPAATRGGHGGQDYRFLNITAATDDLSLTGWNSNGGMLRMFPEMESWNEGAAGNPTFMRGWEADRWDLFGVTDPAQNEVSELAAALGSLALSGDGRYAVGAGQVRGLGGLGDPTHPGWPDYVPRTGNVYLFDLTAGLTDAFPAPGDTRRMPVSTCTAGTEIPRRTAAGELDVQPCPPPAGPGRPALISPRGASLAPPRASQAISRDGARVFFVSPSALIDIFGAGRPPASCSGSDTATVCPPQLYVRQRNPDGSVVTRWVSRPRSAPDGDGGFGGGLIAGQDASLLARVVFEGASRDGSRVFFRTAAPLTPDDPNRGCGASAPPCLSGTPSSTSWDLYMYELPGGPDGDPATPDGDPGAGTLTRISGGPDGDGDCNSPLAPSTSSENDHGGLRFASDAGERAYFVCAAPIGDPGDPWNAPPAGGITAPGGTPTTAGATNLYHYDSSRPLAQRWQFVARLPRATGGIDACASVSALPGQPLQGTTAPPVAPTVPRSCVRGTADGSFVTWMTGGQLTGDDSDAAADIYGYDLAGDELVRISRPAGGAPGGAYLCGAAGPAAPMCNADIGIDSEGSALPNPLEMLGVVADPAVDGDRVVFFESRSRLVGADTDDAYDVYSWRNGELALVSSWPNDTADGAFFLGNDRSGRNVYIATRDRLTWQDHDAVLDVYTARIDGGIPEPPLPPAPCAVLAGACHGGGATPLATRVGSDRPRGGTPGSTRARLFVRRPSRAQRRRAARRGVVALRVRASRRGRVVAVARARVGKRARRVGRGSRRLAGPSARVLRVRLGRRARRVLRSGRVLRVVVRVRMPGAMPRTVRFALRRAGR